MYKMKIFDKLLFKYDLQYGFYLFSYRNSLRWQRTQLTLQMEGTGCFLGGIW